MTPLGQLLRRNLSGIESADRLLWINPPADESWRAILDITGKLTMLSQDYSHWRFLAGIGAKTEFRDFPEPEEAYDHVILTLPRSKPRLEMMLDCIRSILSDAGKIWLLGENNAGIRSSAARLENGFGKARKFDSARHSCLFEATNPKPLPAFNAGNYKRLWSLDEGSGGLRLCSWPGVFAHGRLDGGTQMLMEVLPSLAPFGSVLDFGCGCGVISAWLNKIDPAASITMTDVDALALRSAAETMKLNQCKAKIRPGDGLQKLEQVFDLIVTNPPISPGTSNRYRPEHEIIEAGSELFAPPWFCGDGS